MKRFKYQLPSLSNKLLKEKLNSYGFDLSQQTNIINTINALSFDDENMSEIKKTLANNLNASMIEEFKIFTLSNNWAKRVYYQEVNERLNEYYHFIAGEGKFLNFLSDDDKSLNNIKTELAKITDLKPNPKFEEFILNEISSIYFNRQNENGNINPTQIIENIGKLDKDELKKFY